MSPRSHLVLCILLGILLSFHTRADPQTRVNLNTASSEKLAEALSGVGSAKARNIILFRLENGPFKSIDELALVSGISQRIVEKNRKRITLK